MKIKRRKILHDNELPLCSFGLLFDDFRPIEVSPVDTSSYSPFFRPFAVLHGTFTDVPEYMSYSYYDDCVEAFKIAQKYIYKPINFLLLWHLEEEEAVSAADVLGVLGVTVQAVEVYGSDELINIAL